MNISTFTHQVFQDQIERNVDNAKENETDSHRLKKREALNTTVDSKDSYVIVPSARKLTLSNNGDNRRINVVVHNITSLISDDSRLVDDIRGDNTAPTYRYNLVVSFD